MISFMNTVKGNKYLIFCVKVITCIFLLLILGNVLFLEGLKPFYSYNEYNCLNDFSQGQAVSVSPLAEVSQEFTAQGNLLNNVSLYFGDINSETMKITLFTKDGGLIEEIEVNTSDYTSYNWNEIGLSTDKLVKNQNYILRISCETNSESIYLTANSDPIVFNGCYNEGTDINGTLAMGLQFTYKYFTVGGILELVVKIMCALWAGIALCFATFKIEKLYKVLINSKKKKGFQHALYFSVWSALLFNPLELVRNEVTEFNRVIGSGLISNIDVSKRISNFSNWFLLFAFLFILFFMLCNYILQREKGEESKKAELFLENFMILANCELVLRCITFFSDESKNISVFYFSTYIINLIAIVTICYILFDIEKNITTDNFAKLLLSGVSLSFFLVIALDLKWESGRTFLGLGLILTVCIIIFCICSKKLIHGKYFNSIITIGVIVLSLIPILTSLYIELVHILNQYMIFVAFPAKYYKIGILILMVFGSGFILFVEKKRFIVRKWWGWASSCFIIGIASLSVQIPITSVYYPDIFEGANYSILISDFFQYGKIPIVEHYGGHMMTSVWEGILYGIVNNDTMGAVVSPYSVMLVPMLILLFYYFICIIWDKNVAIFVVLLFPFYNSWSYFGLGMLTCLGVVAYLRKSTYIRAALLWATCIWCILYRLDLGFSFVLAVIASLVIYIIINKNWKAIRGLGFALASWCIVGMSAWCILCLMKGINPINRLLEFLLINLSNQNWALPGVGNPGITLFGWFYLIVPFLSIICLIYTIFSTKMRNNIGQERWILLLIFGWSYFLNFSRGLVRHSLAEVDINVVAWCGCLFLAMFFCCFFNNKKIFLPVFLGFILYNNSLLQTSFFVETSIAEKAMLSPVNIIESWVPDKLIDNYGNIDNNLTYWEKLKNNREKVERVQFHEELIDYVAKYGFVLNALLDEEETFIDFINKTLIYSILEKENPVYISQSPLQLSGEFTQKEFIKEIEDIPVVLMPADDNNSRESNSLDKIPNAYRNFKVSEYIYQNYVPICMYRNYYAVWCLKDKYEEYREKLSDFIDGREYIYQFGENDEIEKSQVKISDESNSSMKIESIGQDPMILELQNVIDTSLYINNEMLLSIDYITNMPGVMQIFYTTEKDEEYTSEKVITVEVVDTGTANFTIPITEFTRLRFDIPENSSVYIQSMITKSAELEYILYGYDGPLKTTDENGVVAYEYTSKLHNNSISHLPRIWAENDTKNAIANRVLAELKNEIKIFTFNPDTIQSGKKGNYLKINASYDGKDVNGLYGNDDEYLEGTIVMGQYQNDEFIEKCRYTLVFKEGKHDYLIRCSTDYYWYLKEVNAIKIETEGTLRDIKMQILEGD